MLEIRDDALLAADVQEDSPVHLPEGLKRIAPGVFRNKHLPEIILPSTLAEIGESAFEGTVTEQVWLPDSLRTLGRRAFYGSLISRVRIPSGIGTVPEECFANAALEKAEVSAGITAFEDRSFFNACFLKEIAFPDSVTRVGEEAFRNCRRMNIDLSLPASCRSVGIRAFYGSGIHQLSLPEEGCEVGADAFAYCWDLQKINVPCRQEYAGDFSLCLRGSDCFRVCDLPDADAFSPLVRDHMSDMLQRCLSDDNAVSSETNLHRLLTHHGKAKTEEPLLRLYDTDLPEERRMTAENVGISPENACQLFRKGMLQFPDAPNRLAALLRFARPDSALTEQIYDAMKASGEIKNLEETVALIAYRKKNKQSASVRPLLFA